MLLGHAVTETMRHSNTRKCAFSVSNESYGVLSSIRTVLQPQELSPAFQWQLLSFPLRISASKLFLEFEASRSILF